MTPMINRHKPNPSPHLRLENGIVKTDSETPNFLITDTVSRKIEFKADSWSNSGLLSKSFESLLGQLLLLLSGKEFALLNTPHYT